MKETDKSQENKKNLLIDKKTLLVCKNCNNIEKFYYKTTLSENKERGMVFLDGSLTLPPMSGELSKLIKKA